MWEEIIAVPGEKPHKHGRGHAKHKRWSPDWNPQPLNIMYVPCNWSATGPRCAPPWLHWQKKWMSWIFIGSRFFFSMRPLDEIKLIPFDTPIFFPSVMRSSAPENGWTGMCTRQPANSFLFLDFALPNKRQFWAYNETQKGSQFLICKDRSRLSAIADKKKTTK